LLLLNILTNTRKTSCFLCFGYVAQYSICLCGTCTTYKYDFMHSIFYND